jgi:hypothetical protein
MSDLLGADLTFSDLPAAERAVRLYQLADWADVGSPERIRLLAQAAAAQRQADAGKELAEVTSRRRQEDQEAMRLRVLRFGANRGATPGNEKGVDPAR